MPEPTIQEIQKTQGTRLNQEVAPWESYESELTGQKMTPELAAQVAEYAQKRYQDAPVSSQSQEVLAENREINEGIAKQYQWLDPSDYADVEARIGKVMSHAEFITKLRQLGVLCFYREHMHPDKLTLLWQPNSQTDLEVACWVQYGMMPELSIMNFDQYGVPLAERRRGWRTPVLQLILKGIITEEKAEKVFGKPRQDKAYDKYNSTLQAFKQAGSRLAD
jgi:hypothetical protein